MYKCETLKVKLIAGSVAIALAGEATFVFLPHVVDNMTCLVRVYSCVPERGKWYGDPHIEMLSTSSSTGVTTIVR